MGQALNSQNLAAKTRWPLHAWVVCPGPFLATSW